MPLARFSLEESEQAQVQLMVDVDTPVIDGGMERVSRGGDGILVAAQTFQEAMATIKEVAATVRDTIAGLAPSEASVELGFKLSAESGVILAKAGGEAHVKLTLTWKK